MIAWLIHYDLSPGPPEKLPAPYGLLDAAEEQGLWTPSPAWGGPRRLRDSVLCGRFVDSAAAIAAFDRAVEAASELLGFELRVQRRLALPLDRPEAA